MSDTSTLKKAEFLFEKDVPDNWEGNWMKVQYNPENFSMSQSTSWQKQPASGGSGISPLQFQSTEPRTITMDLIFDMTVSSVDSGDVYSMFIRRFQNALIPTIKCTSPAPPTTAEQAGNNTSSSAANHPSMRPPRLKFKWGNVEMTGVLKSLKSEYTMFSPEGKAVRAKLSLTLEEYLSHLEAYIPIGAWDGYNIKQVKLVQVQQGQTLSSIAMKAGMTTAALADLNNIANPFELAAGTVLKVLG